MVDEREPGKPRSEEERRKRHKELYGEEIIPSERKGEAQKALGVEEGREPGVPRTEEERAARHEEIYGGSPPTERLGRAQLALQRRNQLIWVIRIILILAILYFVWMVMKS